MQQAQYYVKVIIFFLFIKKKTRTVSNKILTHIFLKSFINGERHETLRAQTAGNAVNKQSSSVAQTTNMPRGQVGSQTITTWPTLPSMCPHSLVSTCPSPFSLAIFPILSSFLPYQSCSFNSHFRSSMASLLRTKNFLFIETESGDFDWWKEIDESEQWQQGIFYTLCASYALVSMIALVFSFSRENLLTFSPLNLSLNSYL